MTWSDLDWSILDRLRDGFLSGSAAQGPYWQNSNDLAHYDFTFAERIGWKWDHVLGELTRRGWQPPSGPILDWGCGSGVAGRCVLRHWPALAEADSGSELHVFDHSLHAEQFAEAQARRVHPNLAVRSWPRDAPIGTLLISHVINELDDDALEDLAEVINRAQAVIWVEPGTSIDAGRLVNWRERLREHRRFIYPCPHQGACGLLAPGNERHWCHHFAVPPPGIFADSNWVKFGQRAGIDLRSLPYSALVFERHQHPDTAGLPPDSGRVIGRPEIFKPYARFLGCDADAVQTLTLPKRSAPKWFKKWDRADAPRLLRWQAENGTAKDIAPI